MRTRFTFILLINTKQKLKRKKSVNKTEKMILNYTTLLEYYKKVPSTEVAS